MVNIVTIVTSGLKKFDKHINGARSLNTLCMLLYNKSKFSRNRFFLSFQTSRASEYVRQKVELCSITRLRIACCQLEN